MPWRRIRRLLLLLSTTAVFLSFRSRSRWRRLIGSVDMSGWQRCLRLVFRQVGAAADQNARCRIAGFSTCTGFYASSGQPANLCKASHFAPQETLRPFYQYLQQSRISSSKSLYADESANLVPISSPLTPVMGDAGTTGKEGMGPKRTKVQAIKKDIRMSPKKLNLVAKLVRGMRVEDALLQLQVTVKRAAKTVYQVIHSARANATHNHGLVADRLLVDEAFVGKGQYLKRVSYHSKGRSGIMVRPYCRLTVVVRETTPEEEAKIAKLRVSNYKKLTRRERQLVPHQLIEVTPRWGRKRKENAEAAAA